MWALVWTSPLICCINHLTSQGVICTMRRLDQIASSRPALPPPVSLVMKGGRIAWSMAAKNMGSQSGGPWFSSRVNHLRRVWHCEMYAIFLSFHFFSCKLDTYCLVAWILTTVFHVPKPNQDIEHLQKPTTHSYPQCCTGLPTI